MRRASSYSHEEVGSLKDTSKSQPNRVVSVRTRVLVVWGILILSSLLFLLLIPGYTFKYVDTDTDPITATGLRAIERGDLELAESSFLESLRRNPNQDRPHSGLATVRRLQGDLEQAQRDIEKAIAINPNRSEYHLTRGSLLREQKRYDEALESCQRAIENDPEYFQAYQESGYIHFVQRDFQEARKFLYRALALKPDLANAERLLGSSYLSENKPQQAIPSWRRLVEREPNNPENHFYLGVCLVEAGEIEEGKQALLRAAELDEVSFSTRVQGRLQHYGLE